MVATRQPKLWVAEFIPFAAATFCLFLRLLSRRLAKAGLWWDDYFAICCYLATVAWAITIPLWISNGFGLHIDDIKNMTSLEANSVTLHFMFTVEQIYAFVVFFAKLSLLFFYWRMFRITNIKIAVYILIGASICWMISRIFVTTFQCMPIQAFWDLGLRPTASCRVETHKYIFGSILSHILIDVFIIMLPILQIKKLQLPWLQKFGVLLMFMFGTLVCIAGLVIISIATKLDDASLELPWDLSLVILWASVEVNLLTVSTCLPTIRPAFLLLTTCANPATTRGSSANTFAESYERPQPKKSIRLSTMAKDETSSTHELAGRLESHGGSFSEPDSHTLDDYQGNIATITSPSKVRKKDGHPSNSANRGGIMVRNDTSVRVSMAKSHKRQDSSGNSLRQFGIRDSA